MTVHGSGMHSTRFWRKVIVGFIGCIFPALYILSSSTSREDEYKIMEELDTGDTLNKTSSESPKTMPSILRRRICQHVVVRRRSFPSIRPCSNYTTRLCEEGTFNLTALVSYPGSGNTWLRHLIEIATGFFTGSVYFDHTLHARGFLGEKEDWSSGSTIVQKLHVKYNSDQNFQKAILLIREPVLATRSFVDYMESGHHTGWASPTTFNRKEWPLFLLHSTHDWLALAKSWIESPTKLHVIHYENLVKSTTTEVRKVLRFLDVDESRLDSKCFMKSVEGSFHRRSPIWKINSPIGGIKVRHSIDDGVDYLNQLLQEHGKEQIPLEKYSCYRNTGDKCIGTNSNKNKQ